MNLSAERISKSYSEKVLFDGISLGIGDGDRIGLIGVNGTGKTTLLRILAGVETPDAGRILISNGARIAFLPQMPVFEPGLTVLEAVFAGDSDEMRLLREYNEALEACELDPSDERSQQRLTALSRQMDALDAWNLESEAKTILTQLGVSDFQADVGLLSGGMRKRAAMAGALIRPCDLLILDEPTNHIDDHAVDWLEKHLARRRGALLMVTHDRYFLERVANRILELDGGRIFSYQANYSRYLEMKLEREELEQAAERKRQNLWKNELAWMRRGAKARTTKQKARIERFEALDAAEGPSRNGSVEIVAGASRLGRKIVTLEGAGKRYGDRTLFSDLSISVARDDRIGIIGPNGVGKSTLLRMLGGMLEPDDGSVSIGETVRFGWFAQENEGMDEKLRAIEYVREGGEVIHTTEGDLSASQMMERFLFPPATQWTPISKLSGGERRRLFLLRMLMRAPNVLLLDEPTNDLDIQTLSVLEAWLDSFPGAVAVVSHDRWFLDRVVDRIYAYEDGGFVPCNGDWSHWRQTRDMKEREERERLEAERQPIGKGASSGRTNGSGGSSGVAGSSASSHDASSDGTSDRRRRKFSFKEQREYDAIEGVIADLEKRLEQAAAALDAHASDFERLPGLLAEQEAVERELEAAYARWEELSEMAESFSKADG